MNIDPIVPQINFEEICEELPAAIRGTLGKTFNFFRTVWHQILIGSFEFFASFDNEIETCEEDTHETPDDVCDGVIQSYLNPSQNASQDLGMFQLNESIVSITSNAEIILQLLRIEKHAAKTGEADAVLLIAQARAIFEQKEI